MIRPILVAITLIAVPAAAVMAGSNRGNESVHQPVVQRNDYVIDVSGNGLSPSEIANIRQWFRAIGLGYGDRVSIDTSSGAASSNQDIATIVGGYGLFLSEGAPVTQGAITPGQVRIIVSRSIASVPGCPDHSRWSQPNFTGATTSNFGCGINSTLAAMVANPDDLVEGQTGAGFSADTAAKAVKVWRETPSSATRGLKIESTKEGN